MHNRENDKGLDKEEGDQETFEAQVLCISSTEIIQINSSKLLKVSGRD